MHITRMRTTRCLLNFLRVAPALADVDIEGKKRMATECYGLCPTSCPPAVWIRRLCRCKAQPAAAAAANAFFMMHVLLLILVFPTSLHHIFPIPFSLSSEQQHSKQNQQQQEQLFRNFEAGRVEKGSTTLLLYASAFQSLLPPFPPSSTAASRRSRGRYSLYALSPPLQMSGRDSALCSCSNGADDLKAFTSISTSGVSKDGSNSSSSDSSDSSTSASTPCPSDVDFCCGAEEKNKAFSRVLDAPAGIAILSVGDTGLPGPALDETTTSLNTVSLLTNARFINLLGDNFYPAGVADTADPLWKSAFDDPFNKPALEKVVFFPLLGNHDYRLNPYAQIDRYMRANRSGSENILNVVPAPSLLETVPVGSAAEAATNQALAKDATAAAAATAASEKPEDFAELDAEPPYILRGYWSPESSALSVAHGADEGVPGDRWRFPNYWYYTRHVFKNVPEYIENPYKDGMLAEDVGPLNENTGSGLRKDVVVVTIYIDTVVMLADEGGSQAAPFEMDENVIFELQLRFIENVLTGAAKDATWIFVCGHHPVITDGNLGRCPIKYAKRMRALLSMYDVDVYLSGHEHMLSLFHDVGSSEPAYIISGSGSKLNSPVGCLRKSCLFNSATHGFVLHLLSQKVLHHVFFDNSGKVLYTYTQYPLERDKNSKISGAASLLLYPSIRRVYIGPFDLTSITPPPRFSVHVYVLLGAAGGALLIFLIALVLFCIRLFCNGGSSHGRVLAKVPRVVENVSAGTLTKNGFQVKAPRRESDCKVILISTKEKNSLSVKAHSGQYGNREHSNRVAGTFGVESLANVSSPGTSSGLSVYSPGSPSICSPLRTETNEGAFFDNSTSARTPKELSLTTLESDALLHHCTSSRKSARRNKWRASATGVPATARATNGTAVAAGAR